jgi:hypothetical protein
LNSVTLASPVEEYSIGIGGVDFFVVAKTIGQHRLQLVAELGALRLVGRPAVVLREVWIVGGNLENKFKIDFLLIIIIRERKAK